MSSQAEGEARRARAVARRGKVTVEVTQLGQPELPTYANSLPEERLAAATRLIRYHQALRGPSPVLPRCDWPGETYTCG